MLDRRLLSHDTPFTVDVALFLHVGVYDVYQCVYMHATAWVEVLSFHRGLQKPNSAHQFHASSAFTRWSILTALLQTFFYLKIFFHAIYLGHIHISPYLTPPRFSSPLYPPNILFILSLFQIKTKQIKTLKININDR